MNIILYMSFLFMARDAALRTVWRRSTAIISGPNWVTRRPTHIRQLASTLSDESSQSLQRDYRKKLLDSNLETLGMDTERLSAAAIQSIEHPTQGYDGEFGKSAIRTYRAFLYPKSKTSSNGEMDEARLSAMAQRTAQQIDFLWKRHKSHETEWIRHHDASQRERQIFPLIVILDNLRSAFNVGSIYRTADAAGCAQVLTTGITPHPNGSGADKLRKSALGADAIVPTQHFTTTREAISFVRETLPHYKIIGLETTERSSLYSEMEYSTEGVALILGNEVTGVDTQIMEELDHLVEIPMFGAKNSLNVASCAPIVLYEVLRQWKVPPNE